MYIGSFVYEVYTSAKVLEPEMIVYLFEKEGRTSHVGSVNLGRRLQGVYCVVAHSFNPDMH